MSADTIFRSTPRCVKLLTSVAARCNLVERGKLKLDEPARQIIDPTLGSAQVSHGFRCRTGFR